MMTGLMSTIEKKELKRRKNKMIRQDILELIQFIIAVFSSFSIIGYGYRKDLVNVIAWGIIFFGIILWGKL